MSGIASEIPVTGSTPDPNSISWRGNEQLAVRILVVGATDSREPSGPAVSAR